MKKKLPLIIFFSLIKFSAFCQEEERQIAREVCVGLTNLDLDQNPGVINRLISDVFREVYAANEEKMFSLYQKYTETGKDVDLDKARKLTGQEIMFFLMKECEYYQRITMFNYGPVPEISETTQKVGKAFTELITTKSMNNKIDEDLVDDCITEASIEHYDLIVKDFGDWSSPEFQKEFQAYLMTKCDPYIRWTVSLMK